MLAENFASSFLSIHKRICQKTQGTDLLGQPNLEQLSQALLMGCCGSASPSCYWEFPLKGEPCLDILVLNHAKNGTLSISSRDYPYKAAFEAAAQLTQKEFCYGLEWDLASNTDALEPGFYIDHADDDALVAAVLAALGVSDRLAAVQQLFAKLPQSWHRYYLGLFPKREGVPVRLGFALSHSVLASYRQEPQLLVQALQSLGYTAFTKEMLQEILQPIYAPFSWDLQLDVCQDGSLGPDLGISYYFNKQSNKATLEYFQTDGIQKFLQYLEVRGLVDARWQFLPQCLFSKLSYCFTEGQLVKLGLENRFNFLKIKWRNGQALPAKFYFESRVVPL